MSSHSTTQSSRGDFLADRCKYGRTTDAHVLYPHASVHAFIFIQHSCVLVRTCVHTCSDGRCVHECTYAHALTLVCSSKHICLLLLAQKPTHIWMQKTGHIFLLYELLDSSVRIFYTHMHAYASLGYLICSARGVQNGTFLKAKNTSPEQTSLLNNTTLVFLSPVLRQAIIIYKGRVFGLLFRERSFCFFVFCFFFGIEKSIATWWMANRP